MPTPAPTLLITGEDGVERPHTDADLDLLRLRKGVRDNSTFLVQDFLPHFEAHVRGKLRSAGTSEDLFRAQGMLFLLDDMGVFIRQKLKSQKGIV